VFSLNLHLVATENMTTPPTAVTLVSVPKPQPPVWSANTDLRTFVKLFGRYLTLAGIPEDKHALRVEYLLVALPSQYYALLELEMGLPGTYTEVTERFLIKAGSPPKDRCTERHAFRNATIRPNETMSEYSGRLALLAATAYPNKTPAEVNENILEQFVESLASTHPLVYRLVGGRHPTTVTEAVTYATEEVRMEGVISMRAQPPPQQQTSVSLPASASSSAHSNLATGSLSEAALTDKLRNYELAEILRAIRSEPNRAGSPRARNYRPYQDRYRQNRNNQNSDDYRSARNQSYNRPGTVPPHIQCYNCGENHFVRNCPKGQRPGQP
jgi:hypothetical protein